MVFVKICGITNAHDARAAVKLGAKALGFNFYGKSTRYISPEKAATIIAEIPREVIKVGVFVNSSREEIENTISTAGIDTLQFHGEETKEFCAQWKGYEVIRAFRVGEGRPPRGVEEYLEVVKYVLFDRFLPHDYGGTGMEIHDECLQAVSSREIMSRAFLAGGIRPANVAQRVKKYHPFAIDVASGVEESPGMKSATLLRALFQALKGEEE